MSASEFTIPVISVRDGGDRLPPQLGPMVDEMSQPRADAREVAQAWIGQGARRLYIVDSEPGRNQGAISAAVEAVRGRAQVSLESAPQSATDVEIMLSTGCRHVVVDATVPFLVETIKKHGSRITVKVGLHESLLSTHATARDGSDLWPLLARLESLGVSEYVIANTDHHGHWHHKSLGLLSAVLESLGPPAISFGGVTRLEDLHALAALSKEGLIGCAVSEGLHSGAFTMAEAEAAVEPRFDPYIWAPADPTLPQVSDSGQG